MSFQGLGLSEAMLRTVADAGYSAATPIQTRAIPVVFQGRDLLACAQTGTGKSAAFLLPILQRLSQPDTCRCGAIRALVLVPTRELAVQLGDSVRLYGRHARLRSAVVHGGVSQRPQVAQLRRGVDMLIATPGRLLDLIQQRHIDLGSVEIVVLDEGDRMLDMGFAPDVRRIVALTPRGRQMLLFSATLAPAVRKLAGSMLANPVTISVAPSSTAAETVEQWIYPVARADKLALLLDLLGKLDASAKVLVFARTKRGAERLSKRLARAGHPAAAIHGNKSQNARTKVLGQFRGGSVRVLVASDVAARGIDVLDISHVINFDLPSDPETYVHRIGRTGRAGARGVAVSLCAGGEDDDMVRDIECLMRRRIPVASARTHRPARLRRPKKVSLVRTRAVAG